MARRPLGRVHGAAIALAAGAAVGCDVPPDPPVDVRTCELGTGDQGFEPLADGDVIDVHQGAQGGYHLFAGARAWDMVPGDPLYFDEDNPWIDFSAFRDGAAIDVSDPLKMGLSPVGDGVYEVTGRAVVLDTAVVAPLEEFEGAEIEVEVSITDADGVHCVDRRSVTVRAVYLEPTG